MFTNGVMTGIRILITVFPGFKIQQAPPPEPEDSYGVEPGIRLPPIALPFTEITQIQNRHYPYWDSGSPKHNNFFSTQPAR